MPSLNCLLRRDSAVFRAGVAGLVVIAGWLALVPLAVAQNADDDDAPGRVGRVALYQGSLFLAPQDRATEWAAVGLNYPVTVGDNLWMSGDGRAEIDYGSGQFRLGGDSNVHVSRLDDRTFALFVAQGRVIVRVRALEPGESAVIDTPNAQLELQRPGLYRIDVSPEPRQTWLIVREGEANVVLQSGLQQVLPGQTATVAGADGGVAEVRNGVSVDGLDTWSAERDRVYERGRQSTAYVSRQMPGYADLDAYGSWQTYPEYGPVWFPATVVDDWAPYRYGRWVWLSAYGWTWVDDAPWGYAPFHYGRWAYVGGRWGWCPGAYVARPVWAPALVAWYGGNNWRYSVSVGAPVFGWVALGWREPYVPWWGRCSGRCYERYNRPYAVNFAEQRPHRPITSYVNAAVPGAITAVPGAALRDTRPVQTTRVTLPPNAIAAAPVLGGAPQVRPVVSSTNVVRPGHGAPLPAGEIAARVKPLAVAPATHTDSGYTRARVMPAPGTTSVGPAQRTVTPAPVAAPPAAAPARVTPFDGRPLRSTRVAPNPAPQAPTVSIPPSTQAPPPRGMTHEYVERPVRAAPPASYAPAPVAPPPVSRVQSAPPVSRVQSAPPAYAPPAPVPHVQPAPSMPRVQPAPSMPHVQPAPSMPHAQPAPSMPHAQPAPSMPHVQPAPPPQPRETREPRGEKPAGPHGPKGPGPNQN